MTNEVSSLSRVYKFLSQKADWAAEADGNGDGAITKAEFSKYLKENGTIVYSTCSILKEENKDIVDGFLKENKEYYIKPEETLNILPNEEKDGFFICKIYRK